MPRLIALCILLLAGPLRADWPARIFAPYVFLGSNDGFQLTGCDDATSQKHYTLAFIIADKENNPAWFGRVGMEKGLYADQIEAIRKRGGDVLISFGGAAGTELAIAETDAAALQAKYQSIIDRYKFTWLDFDIEGKALANAEANGRRNAAAAGLQGKNPGLRVSYTLPVDPNGISGNSQKLLADAKAKGVKVYSVNIMTMDFGARHSRGKRMSEVSIASAVRTFGQCQRIDPSILIGLTPMIGQNDVKEEVFGLEDAVALRDWAAAKPWVCSMSFWSSNRDTGKPGRNPGTTRSGIQQQAWEFTNTFKSFGAARPEAGK
jgi:hypothetical protein